MAQVVRVLDKGHVALMDWMPRDGWVSMDQAIVQAARASTRVSSIQLHEHTEDLYLSDTEGLKGDEADKKLLKYLWENGHTSPFEMVELKFHVRAPLFVARQWMRHRTWNYNEMSGRYQEIPDEFYYPESWRKQSQTNRQASGETFTSEESAYIGENPYDNAIYYAKVYYRELLKLGVSREMARMVLPVSVYTEFYAKTDLRNLIHFLKLRDDDHAQWEIREYARAIKELITPLCPQTMALAFPSSS